MTNHTKSNTTFNIGVIAFAVMHVSCLAVVPAIEDADALKVKKILKKAFGTAITIVIAVGPFQLVFANYFPPLIILSQEF